MKKTKIILVATLGICMLSFMPSVLGAANKRPITALTDTNIDIAGWMDPETNLMLWPHGPFWWVIESIADCEPSGFVLERELKDERILYKVNLHVKGALMLIFWYDEEDWEELLVFEGEMDYYLTTTIIVEGEVGDPLPWLYDVWFYGAGECTFSHLTGSGTGVFTELGEFLGFGLEGESAKVKVNQVGIGRPPEHPQIDPDVDPYNMWPVELVFFH